jgi:hypothetical protein
VARLRNITRARLHGPPRDARTACRCIVRQKLRIASSNGPRLQAARLLNRDVFNRIGDYSLGIYVLHAAVIWWAHLVVAGSGGRSNRAPLSVVRSCSRVASSCVAGGVGLSWPALRAFDFSPAGPLGRHRGNCWGKGAGCALIGAKFRAHFDGVPFAWDVGPLECVTPSQPEP